MRRKRRHSVRKHRPMKAVLVHGKRRHSFPLRRRHMRGRGFWSDFGNGFVKGFTKTMDIGNQLLPLAKLL